MTDTGVPPLPHEPDDASATTRSTNEAVAAHLHLDDPGDFALATRGRVATLADGPVLNSSGWPVWDPASFTDTSGDAPATVNPSLWRQARLNAISGLFEVTDRIWQVRGLDISNLTVVAGDTGWIVIDTLTTAETSAAAMALVNEHLGARPVVAVIITHSHLDHFGGIRGVVDTDDVASGRVPIFAPAGFLEAAASENVIAGTVMNRRATYMYGMLLPRTDRGHVDSGLGRGTPLLGTSGLLAPTHEITTTGERHTIDGVEVEFHLTPGTEAPAEMNFLFPDLRALCMAENCTATLHNVYTPRGAVVRDALTWSTYIDEAMELYRGRADVVFATHHWPRWGADQWMAYLTVQRDAYRYLHDQTMRLANHGLVADEIAETLQMPPTLASHFHVRDYYGTVRHNTRAVYQRYLGYFDANPATLNPYPRVERAQRYVSWMGGADEVLDQARASFDAGDYRWVAEVVNHVVFADPSNRDARLLQAATLEQLGYQAESGPWRDFYLTGAQELRNGTPSGKSAGAANADSVAAMTTGMLLTWLGVHVNGPDAAEAGNLSFTLQVVGDESPLWDVGLSNGALYATAGRAAPDPDATLALPRPALARLVLTPNAQTLAELEADGTTQVGGDRSAVERLLSLCDTFNLWFGIIEPRPNI
jgi:alkyl sulfatase BDS1-like metallo-beta-lactamase superfamily hydrolase